MSLSPIQNLNTSKIQLKISDVSSDVASNFPTDPQPNVQIVLKMDKYFLQKEILGKNSEYFLKGVINSTEPHQINQQLDQKAVRDILFVLYGGTVSVDRELIMQYLHVIQYFQIRSLISLITCDIKANVQHYDVFDLITIADKYHNEEIFSVSIEQLQKQKFEQMKYHQQTLLHLQITLFKLVLKSHNQYKKKQHTNISYPKINQFIIQYSLIHNIDEQQAQQIKFQIFDITVLSSADYKQIFMEDIPDAEPPSPVMKKPSLKSSLVQSLCAEDSNLDYSGRCKIAESMIKSTDLKTSNQLKMKIIITFLNKKNQQLQHQNSFLTSELAKIKKLTQENQGVHKQLKVDIEFLKQQLTKKESRQIQNKKIISQIQPMLTKLQQEIQKKSQEIDRLMQYQKIKKVNKSPEKQKPILDVQIKQPETSHMPDTIVQSQFLSANFIHQMFSGPQEATEPALMPVPKGGPVPKKKKKAKTPSNSQNLKFDQMDEQQIQQLYIHRVQFDEEPKGFKKSEFPKICKFLPADFNKKSLKLIYRRSLSYPKKGQDEDIRSRNHLLVLISTQLNYHIGGYISTSLPKDTQGKKILEDKNSFLFTTTNDKKIPIDPTQAQNAIVLSDQLLIGFGNDLQIAKDCLFDTSICNWPVAYTDSTIGSKSSQWLAGTKEFFIKDLQIYQINDVEMEMVL